MTRPSISATVALVCANAPVDAFVPKLTSSDAIFSAFALDVCADAVAFCSAVADVWLAKSVPSAAWFAIALTCSTFSAVAADCVVAVVALSSAVAALDLAAAAFPCAINVLLSSVVISSELADDALTAASAFCLTFANDVSLLCL